MASNAARLEVEDQSKGKVFISYSRKDIAFADRLDAALKARGFEPLIDRTNIYAFEEWWTRVEALIERADTIVFVLSPDAVRPGTVALKEVAFAGSLNKRFAPIIFRPVDDESIPEVIAKLNFIFFDDPSQFERSADQLAEALNTDISWIRKHTEFGEQARRWALAKAPIGLLLRSPALEQAEYWITMRPRGTPAPTEETRAYIRQSRESITRQRVRARRVQVLIYTLLVGIIVGLVGWINQADIKEQWRWFTITRPYMLAHIRPRVLEQKSERSLKPMDSFVECAETTRCPEMIVIPAGSFVMGSPSDEKGRDDNESPQHEVTISAPFAVSKHALTFDEWDACVAYGNCSPVSARHGRGQQPVDGVSWEDAKRYVKWISRTTGKDYRLLTEAEYEFAARAGTQTAYLWGGNVGIGNANCNGCGSRWDNMQPAPVGSFPPNRFGLHDMIGNLWEWVEDCFNPDYSEAPTDGSAWTTGDCTLNVVRGGAWNRPPRNLRSAQRHKFPSNFRTGNLGFRVGRTLSP